MVSFQTFDVFFLDEKSTRCFLRRNKNTPDDSIRDPTLSPNVVTLVTLKQPFQKGHVNSPSQVTVTLLNHQAMGKFMGNILGFLGGFPAERIRSLP